MNINELANSMAKLLKMAEGNSLLEKYNIEVFEPMLMEKREKQYYIGYIAKTRVAKIAEMEAMMAYPEKEMEKDPFMDAPDQFFKAELQDVPKEMLAGLVTDGPFETKEEALKSILVHFREDLMERIDPPKDAVDDLNNDIETLGGDESSKESKLSPEDRLLNYELQSLKNQSKGLQNIKENRVRELNRQKELWTKVVDKHPEYEDEMKDYLEMHLKQIADVQEDIDKFAEGIRKIEDQLGASE